MERLKGCSRKLMILLALLVLTAGLALPAAADMGPKPSVEVVFRGLEGQRYQVTLLADVTQYGPWSANQGYSDWMGDPEGWDAFADYPAPEGWYFLGEYADCTETGRFVWSYYPPETFYVLVWLPDSGRYLCSTQPVSRYAFDSRFTAAVEGNALTVQPSYDYAGEAVGLVVRAALTILLETAAAWLLFGLRRRDQWVLILKVNLVTQLALNLLLNLCGYFYGPLWTAMAYGLLELLVFVAEGWAYARWLRWGEDQKPHPWLYALASNILSFAAGWELARWLPGVF